MQPVSRNTYQSIKPPTLRTPELVEETSLSRLVSDLDLLLQEDLVEGLP